MMGHRGIYADGWEAVTRHTAGVSFDDDDWELYHLAEDRSECNNLAAEMPDKVSELVELWWSEATEHGVLPLDDRTIELFGTRFRDNSVHPPSRRYTYYPPMTQLPGQVAPALGGRGFTLLATIDRPAGAGGVLYASGTENSGLSIFVADDHLVFDYNCFGEHQIATSGRPVPEGSSVVGIDFRRVGRGATAELLIDGEAVASMEIPFAMYMMSSIGPSVGFDHGSQVSQLYDGPSPFSGTLHRVDIALAAKPGEDAEAAATDERSAMSRQ